MTIEMKRRIDKKSVIPYYIQLKDIILEKIKNSEFRDGKVDSEHKLSSEYGITISTVRKSLSELENDGLIYKIKGVGTFIRKPRIDMDISKFLIFGKILKEKGFSEDVRIIRKKQEILANKTLDYYGIEQPGKVTIFERVRLIDSEPIAIEKFTVSNKICTNIEEIIDSVEIYKYLTETLNIHLTKVKEFIEPINLKTEESKILQTRVGASALLINEIIYCNDEWLILGKTIIKGDKCRYHLTVR